LGNLNPPPQLTEFKHPRCKDGPNLKDPRKAMIEQIHFQTHAYTKNTHPMEKAQCCNAEVLQSPRANVCSVPDRPPIFAPRWGHCFWANEGSPARWALKRENAA
jgi:hypothetical protein